MSGSSKGWLLLTVLVTVLLFGLFKLYDLRLSSGDVYPVYSSLRTDPVGTKAFYESLLRLDGYMVRRNFRAVDKLTDKNATILELGEDPYSFSLAPEDELKRFEAIANRGVRLVLAMRPVKRIAEHDKQPQFNNGPLAKRWGVTFEYVRRPVSEEEERPLPKRTALIMRAGQQVAPVIEKQFGAGSVVLIDNTYAFSNEALLQERDTPLLARAVGGNRTIIFDENRLGVTETASIAMLARRYRLGGLVAGLFLLAFLFVWKNSTPLLPRHSHSNVDIERGRADNDANAALTSLLRRHVPEAALLETCLAEWEKSGHGGRYYSESKLKRVREVARDGGKSVREAHRAITRILAEQD